jgi:hypothetical protein
VTGALCAILFVVTLFDRTIPRVISTPAAAKGDAPAPHMKETNMPLTKLDDSSRFGRDRSAKRHCRVAVRTPRGRDRRTRREARERFSGEGDRPKGGGGGMWS